MKENIVLIVVLAAATMITRFLPFIIFPAGKETPPYIDFLGKTLPFATIGLLVVYCLKGSFLGLAEGLWSLAEGTGFSPELLRASGIPEFLAAVLIICLHRWKENSLLSIGIGTAVYMLLVQVVF